MDKATAFLAAMPEEAVAKSTFTREMDANGGAGLSADLKTDEPKPSRAAAALNLVKSK